MTKSQTCYPSSSSSKLGIHRGSHPISKFKPKIRIIHVCAPEIIKTDAANFRELVQRLTGKPEDEEEGGSRSKKAKTHPPTKDPMDFHSKQIITMEEEEEEEEEEFLGLQNGIRMKNEEKEGEIWGRSKSNNEKFGGFFDGFSELDGFMEELITMPVVNLK